MSEEIDVFEKFLASNSQGYLLENIPADAYHARRDFLSKHMLDIFAESPEKYAYALKHETGEKAPALAFGEALHSLILTPDAFATDYVRIPETIKVRRGKEWEALASANAGKHLLFPAEFDKLTEMKRALKKHETAEKLLFHGRQTSNELTVLFHHPKFQIPCKARLDRVLLKDKTIIDLKTTTNASPEKFTRSVIDFRYDVQGAFYIDAMQTATKILDGWRFVILAIEKEPPYAIGVYYLDEWIALGRETYLRDMKNYNECEIIDTWSGYHVKHDVLPAPEDWVVRTRKLSAFIPY